MLPLNINSIQSSATALTSPEKSSGRPMQRIEFSDVEDLDWKANHQIALSSQKIFKKAEIKEGFFGKILRALGLRKWVVLHVSMNNQEGYVKVNAESLRKRFGLLKNEFKEALKSGIDLTPIIAQKLPAGEAPLVQPSSLRKTIQNLDPAKSQTIEGAMTGLEESTIAPQIAAWGRNSTNLNRLIETFGPGITILKSKQNPGPVLITKVIKEEGLPLQIQFTRLKEKTKHRLTEAQFLELDPIEAILQQPAKAKNCTNNLQAVAGESLEQSKPTKGTSVIIRRNIEKGVYQYDEGTFEEFVQVEGRPNRVRVAFGGDHIQLNATSVFIKKKEESSSPPSEDV